MSDGLTIKVKGQDKMERQIENLSHLTRLAEAMTPDPRDYEYTGECNDLGAMVGQCACGHAIRYEFVVRSKTTGKTVPIGSTCIEESVPFLIAAGNEALAAALKAAVEKHREALAEAERQKREALANEEVVALTTYWDTVVKPWYAQEKDNWRKERRTWLPQIFYKPLVKLEVKTTPGRTAASIRTKIVKLAYDAFSNKVKFPLPDDPKVIEKFKEKLAEENEGHLRMIARGEERLAKSPGYVMYEQMLADSRKAYESFLSRMEYFTS